MPSQTAPRTLTVLARAAGVAALALLAAGFAYGWFAYPADASCYTADGYDAIRAHFKLLTTLALLALAAAVTGGIVCVAGVAIAPGRRLAFLLGGLAFVPMGLAALFLVFVAAFYCQN